MQALSVQEESRRKFIEEDYDLFVRKARMLTGTAATEAAADSIMATVLQEMRGQGQRLGKKYLVQPVFLRDNTCSASEAFLAYMVCRAVRAMQSWTGIAPWPVLHWLPKAPTEPLQGSSSGFIEALLHQSESLHRDEAQLHCFTMGETRNIFADGCRKLLLGSSSSVLGPRKAQKDAEDHLRALLYTLEPEEGSALFPPKGEIDYCGSRLLHSKERFPFLVSSVRGDEDPKSQSCWESPLSPFMTIRSPCWIVKADTEFRQEVLANHLQAFIAFPLHQLNLSFPSLEAAGCQGPFAPSIRQSQMVLFPGLGGMVEGIWPSASLHEIRFQIAERELQLRDQSRKGNTKKLAMEDPQEVVGVGLRQLIRRLIDHPPSHKALVLTLLGCTISSYVLRIRDRHHANFLLTSLGELVNVDFGFLLEHAPGGALSIEGDLHIPDDLARVLFTDLEDSQPTSSKYQLNSLWGEFSEAFGEALQQCRERWLSTLTSYLSSLPPDAGVVPCFKGESIDFVIGGIRDRLSLDKAKAKKLLRGSLFHGGNGNYNRYQWKVNRIY